ncbi:uncharacterized protein A1O9_07211 [Exophiala aquamarina CBS 119918]|uniref:BZIP domain-containing protein n=1 Tax=Exophiala aquamarina CBS 119918 TaxID=1182545 RepID=A0A072PAW8_9EURO|nr:uncharacterized protein A1O9_07211 [Exophiala aquamarina CBS 119918]KEF57021.1 hypothetical protein A1O9_07211 [Exophiala aquamarina CBS 119918]
MDSPPPDPSSSGQWASGRKLTKSQREKKRAIDRERVRQRREQYAERIVTLEAKLAEVTAELEDLKRSRVIESSGTLSTNAQCGALIPRDVSGMLNDVSWMDTTLGIPAVTSNTLPVYSMGAIGSFEPYVEDDTHMLPNSTQLILPNESAALQVSTSEIAPLDPYLEGANSLDRSQKSDCQRILGRSVQKARSLSAADVCIDTARNDDVLIRGIMHGWDHLKARYEFFCPLWAALEDLDNRIFRRAGAMTRLPVLRMVHSLLLCLVKANSISNLPSWYRPRKAQYQVDHPLCADLLPWPKLRERAVLSSSLTQTNKFWTELVYSFRFGFPHDKTIHEAISLDNTTDRWSFSGLFLNHILEIRVWHIDQDFFHNWPETYGDIVPAPEIGRSLAFTSGCGSPQEFLWRAAGSGARIAGDGFRPPHHYHNHLLPLPVREGDDGKRSNTGAEDDNSWEVLSWRMPVPVSVADVPHAGSMPTVFVDS